MNVDPSAGQLQRGQNRYDTIRLFAAWLVLVAHCFILGGITPGDLKWLEIAAYKISIPCFFAVSGYLVYMSALRSKNVFIFIKRRVLRIYPGLIVVIFLCTFVLGPATTNLSICEYFSSPMTWLYLESIKGFIVHYHLPGVFINTPYPGAVNGSIWSLKPEIECYLALSLFFMWKKHLRYWVLVTFFLIFFAMIHREVLAVFDAEETIGRLNFVPNKLWFIFAVGAILAAFPQKLVVQVAFLAIATAGENLHPSATAREICFSIWIAITVNLIAQRALWLPDVGKRFGDWSYGVYLYAFPIQQVLSQFGINKLGFLPYLASSTIITFACAGLSWHFVGKIALRYR